jgi:hypothetical protein
LGVARGGNNYSYRKNVKCYGTFHNASDLDWSFGATQAVEIGVNGRIILKRIFKKWDGAARTELLRLRIGTGGGLL